MKDLWSKETLKRKIIRLLTLIQFIAKYIVLVFAFGKFFGFSIVRFPISILILLNGVDLFKYNNNFPFVICSLIEVTALCVEARLFPLLCIRYASITRIRD